MKLSHYGSIALALFATAACGGTTTTVTPKTADATSAVAAAETVVGKDTPKASLHLKLARDQLDQAKQLMREGEDEKAALVLKRAKADAELALFLAREADAKAKAERARQQVEALSQKD